MATNELLTADIIVKEGLSIFKNSAPFFQTINRQYDKTYEVAGAKVGDTIRIKRPQRYSMRTGKTAVVQGTNEQSVTLAIANQFGCDLEFSSAELAQDIGTFSEEFIQPAIQTIVAGMQSQYLQTAYQATYNLVGTAGTDPAANLVYGQAKAKLTNFSAPEMGRSVLLNPNASAATIGGLTTIFNPQTSISNQYINGSMGKMSGFDFYETVGIRSHTNGAFAGTVLVNQPTAMTEGDTAIDMDAFTDAAPTLKVGDVFTVAGTYALNPLTKTSTGQLMQFVVTADKTGTSNAAAGISISPSPYTTGPLANVSQLPANNAVVTFVGTASTAYAQNLAYHKNAFALATCDLPLYGNTNFESRRNFDGISLRLQKVVDGINDTFLYRFDVLAGFCAPIPEWATRIIGASV